MNTEPMSSRPGTRKRLTVSHDKRSAPLRECVHDAMNQYLRQLGDYPAQGLYKMVIAEVEEPLLRSVMRHTRDNQTQAASLLGISRSTLRKKLAQYRLGSDGTR